MNRSIRSDPHCGARSTSLSYSVATVAVVVCDVVTTDWEEVEAFVAIVAMLCETWLMLSSAVVSNVSICVCRSWSCCIESEYPGISIAGIPANISCSRSACDEVSPPPKRESQNSDAR